MSVETEERSVARRKLMLHDALTFASLALVTVALFAVTLGLFRSFAAHRDALARRWAGRGQAALTAGRPGEAIVALRTALSYAPDWREYELLLAQALGDAGHTEESYNYFLGLWETQPGDGFINLRLARLAAAKKDSARDAEKFYRASIYGTWEGDATVRRLDVRLELARYLLDRHENNAARADLLVAGGNNPDDMGLALRLAGMLQEAGAQPDALTYYGKVLASDPRNGQALEGAGQLEFAAGNFEEARRLLERAARGHGSGSGDVSAMLRRTERILGLMPSKKLSARERVNRILAARTLAKKRFAACSAELTAKGESSSALQGLSSAWADKGSSAGAVTLRASEDAQDAAVKLIFDTEVQTSEVCGAPSGDDALLLLLARSPGALEE